MPGIVKVRILEGRDLPIMDRASELTDAYVDVKFHERTIFRTQVCSKTLCPKWNSDWFTFEVDDEQIQEDLLQIKVFDKDTVTANDPIGKVHVSLVPLTSPGNPNYLTGWFPIFDTLHGIRGEIKIIVKVKYISDTKQSSCGVKFFYSKTVPSIYHLVEVKSFVEELVIEDDPEYKWIDKIRTTRASNEARQLLFLRLASSLQRKIGSKVLDLGGNAVIGYRQCLDLEGSFGVVVRAIGTCVTIKENRMPPCSPTTPGPDYRAYPADSYPITPEYDSPHKVLPLLLKQSSVSKSSVTKKHSCTSDSLSDTGMSFPDATSPVQFNLPIIQPKMASNYADFPFYTMGSFPPGFVTNIGGLVSSRSVRLLDKLETMSEESDTRDKLWLELRKEVRTHMKTLGCTAVIGYSEQSTICDKLCVLSAIGTAVILNPSPSLADEFIACKPCHIPYNVQSSPFNITPHNCSVCGSGKVPDILLTTIDILPNTPVNGNGCFIQVQAFRTKKKQTGENSARDIGQQLPFLEYEIHQQLSHKLKIKGMNAVVGIRYELCVGETAILYIASGTAVYLSALPPASPLRVRCDTAESTQVDKLQEAIQAAYEKNVTCYNISRSESISGPAPDLNLSVTNKIFNQDVIVVDIEDPKDEKKIENSLKSLFLDHMFTSSSSTVPGVNGDMIPCEAAHIMTQICRIDTPGLETADLDKIINKNMQLLCFKLRKYKSCFLSNIRFNVHMPDDDELVILISAIGTISLPVSPVVRAVDTKRRFHRFLSSASNEIRFCEEELNSSLESSGSLNNTAVQLTPADHIPGATVQHCFGHLSVFLIRESADVRDLSSFTKNFIMEAQAIMRAHVASLGGNVLFEFRISELVLIDGPQKFQAQILLSISGDAAHVIYENRPSSSSG
ncbi:C2 domain-containing protein 5-like isoform X3 [Bolinopsis microptera]|uniref:C2 domain-containing protein 5-like isoform X3 n=1 Tax=Bolinopsis microptera TaxID=2820187 RepID=UPI0030799A5C